MSIFLHDMIKSLLRLLKRILGTTLTDTIRPLGHGLKSYFAAVYYRFPASKLTIIGITGTKGKTSTTLYTGRLLNLSGLKTGYVSTAALYDGQDHEVNGNPVPFEQQNVYKMTSVDGVVLHRTLREMVNNGCKYVVLELSSQGLAQNRHWGLGTIDVGVFLNITPEHLEAHGGWDNYLKAKSILFQNLDKEGVFISESKEQYAEYMWQAIPEKARVTKSLMVKGKDYDIKQLKHGNGFTLQFNGNQAKHVFDAPFEAINSAFALSILQTVKRKAVTPQELEYLDLITQIPGRMQWVLRDSRLISEGSEMVPGKALRDTDIIVDYAHEPASMRQLLETLYQWKKSTRYAHIVHILSCDGAGRDDWKKPEMGDISYLHANYTILTTDNYDENDDPREIIDLLGKNFPPEKEGKKFIREIDRRKAFQKAIDLSIKLNGKTIIVSTGVGSEFGLTQPGGVMPWNEAQVWHQLIEQYSTRREDKPSNQKTDTIISEKKPQISTVKTKTNKLNKPIKPNISNSESTAQVPAKTGKAASNGAAKKKSPAKSKAKHKKFKK